MKSMTTKEFLMQPFKLQKRIIRLHRKLEQESKESAKPILLAKEEELILIYNQKTQDVKAAIYKLKDGRHKEVLERRYLLFQKWEQIALAMAYDYRYIFRLHGYALKEVEDTVAKGAK